MEKIILSFICVTIFLGTNKEDIKNEYVNSFNGVKIAYQVSGSGEIPLVFVHGWCCDKSYWKEQVKALKNDYKIITIDLAGHGDSETGREKYTIPNFAKDVAAVIEHLNLDKFILLGHSMGSVIILETALLFPQRVIALFPIDGYTEIPKIKTEDELRDFEADMRSRKKIEDFCERTYNSNKSRKYPKSDSTLMEKIARDMSLNDPHAGIESNVNAYLWYYSEFPIALKNLEQIPVIDIVRNDDIDEKQFIDYGLTKFQEVNMAGLGHFFILTHPEKTNKILKEKLAEVTSSN